MPCCSQRRTCCCTRQRSCFTRQARPAESPPPEKVEKHKKKEKPESLDPRCIYYDNDGILRYGPEPRDRDTELKRVLRADNPREKEGKVWYLVESGWVKSWLAFAHYNKNSPAPGPVQNEFLLEWKEEGDVGMWVPRRDLIAASASQPGHYRRVNAEVWHAYVELYPGSGPAISVVDRPFEDHSRWTVDQEPLTRLADVIKGKRGTNKKRASLLPGLSSPQVMGALLMRHTSGKGKGPSQSQAEHRGKKKGENEATSLLDADECAGGGDDEEQRSSRAESDLLSLGEPQHDDKKAPLLRASSSVLDGVTWTAPTMTDNPLVSPRVVSPAPPLPSSARRLFSPAPASAPPPPAPIRVISPAPSAAPPPPPAPMPEVATPQTGGERKEAPPIAAAEDDVEVDMTSDDDEAPPQEAVVQPPTMAYVQTQDAAADTTQAAVGGGEVAGGLEGTGGRPTSMPIPPPPRMNSSSSVGSTKAQAKRANNGNKRDGTGGFRFAGKSMDPNSLL